MVAMLTSLCIFAAIFSTVTCYASLILLTRTYTPEERASEDEFQYNELSKNHR